LPAPAALAAEDGLKYDSSRGEGIVKTLSGGLYIGLLLYFLFKVLNRRARKAREEVRPDLQRCHSMLAVWHAQQKQCTGYGCFDTFKPHVPDSDFWAHTAMAQRAAGMLNWVVWENRLPPRPLLLVLLNGAAAEDCRPGASQDGLHDTGEQQPLSNSISTSSSSSSHMLNQST
jgi:hypothetical protein